MINLVYSGNNIVFKGILLSTMSVIKHCKEPINIFVLSMSMTELRPKYTAISDSQIDVLDRVLKRANPESSAILIDVKKYHEQFFATSPNRNTEYTPYCLNRLFLDIIDAVPDENVLYLDSDTMATSDVSELFNMDISDYEFAVALDYMGKFWIARDYFNSGVMLLNMAKIRETGLMVECRKLVATKWLKLPDQSALYRRSVSRLYLDGRFNEQRDIKPNTVIKHFCKGIKYFPFFHIYNIKQWDFEKVHNNLNIFDFDDIFSEYVLIKKDNHI